MRVDSTEPLTYITGQSRKVTDQNMSGHIVRSVWLVLGPSRFSQDVVLSVLYGHCFRHLVVCAQKIRKSATHTFALSRAHSTSPPGRPDSSNPMFSTSTPTSELAMQSTAPASSLVEPPPAASPQVGRWICQQGLRSARIRGLLLLLLPRRVLYLPFYVWS